MDMERMERLMKAKEYQKKALMALLPEEMQGHVEVIGDEIKAMVKESFFQMLQSEEAMEFIKSMMMAGTTAGHEAAGQQEYSEYQDQQKYTEEQECSGHQEHKKSGSVKASKVKKVDIS